MPHTAPGYNAMNRWKRAIFRAILVLLPVAAAWIAGECALRAHAKAERSRNEKAWASVYASRPPLQQGLAMLMDLLRSSPHPRIIYELRPGLDVEFRGARVTTNELGFRGAALPGRKTNTFRVIAIGDSSLFGWGVGDDETYLSVLQRLLAGKHPNVDWQLLNAGVPGYNTVMEIETLKHRCLGYRPDLVLVHHVVNDVNIPHFLAIQGDRKRPLGSFVLEWVAHRGAPLAGDANGLYMRDPNDVPAQYRTMVGESACVAAFRDLKELSVSNGFDVVVATDTRAPAYLRAVARELDFPLMEYAVPVEAYLKANGQRSRVAANLVLDRHDDHYSPQGHRLIAEYLSDVLVAMPPFRRRVANLLHLDDWPSAVSP
jgi:lysophospholipase L1-like esterase